MAADRTEHLAALHPADVARQALSAPISSYGPQTPPNDYRIANRPDNPNWRGVAAWFDDAARATDAVVQP